MLPASDPIIAIVGNVRAGSDAVAAAEALGRELAKAGFRSAVYASGPDFLEVPLVKGYVATQVAKPRSIEVRYPLNDPKLQGQKPAFAEQTTDEQLFDPRADRSSDWEWQVCCSLPRR